MDLIKKNKYLQIALYTLAFLILVISGCFFLHSTENIIVNLISSGLFVLGGLMVGLIINSNKQSSAEKLLTEYKRIEESKKKFKDNYPRLFPLMLSIIEERIIEIESAAQGVLPFTTEVQRESFTSKLFAHLDKIPNLKKIQSLTWDYDGFFSDQWISSIKLDNFYGRNAKAQSKGVEIERLFIFRKNKVTQEIKDAFKSLQIATTSARLTPIKFLYEEDLKASGLEIFIKSPSSFLLFIDHMERVKIHTENCKIENDKRCKLEARFYTEDDTSLNDKQARFKRLWLEKGRTAF